MADDLPRLSDMSLGAPGQEDRHDAECRYLAACEMKGEGDLERALRVFRDLLPDMVRWYGPVGLDTVATRSQIASCVGLMGDPAEAVRLLQELLADVVRVRGAGAPEAFEARGSIAHWTGMSGDPGEALRQLQELLAEMAEDEDDDPETAVPIRRSLAHWTEACGDPDTALRLLRGLLPDMVLVYGEDNPETLAARAAIDRLAADGPAASGARRAGEPFEDRAADLPTVLLPVLHRPLEAPFNVFDVMHHGTHEKQLSNVFRWLLETQASHRLGDTFLRIFIEEVDRGRRDGGGPLPIADYLVMQEVDVSARGAQGQDIADLVLKNDAAVIVVENYFTSDGHGHSYQDYLAYSKRGGREGAVVLLCHERDSSLQTGGWEDASVVTYGRLLERLHEEVGKDRRYRRDHPEPYSFIDQMYRKFVTGRGRVDDHQVLDFVVAVCAAGQAGRYAEARQDAAAERFANDVAEQARERFGEGRELLRRTKARLRNYSDQTLRVQLNETLGEGFVGKVSAGFRGNYEWTVNFHLPGIHLSKAEQFGELPLQLKFGPSAWFANEQDPNWKVTVDPRTADYSHLFITWMRTRELRQSSVTVQEVLDGLPHDDRRLHDEIVAFLDGKL